MVRMSFGPASKSSSAPEIFIRVGSWASTGVPHRRRGVAFGSQEEDDGGLFATKATEIDLDMGDLTVMSFGPTVNFVQAAAGVLIIQAKVHFTVGVTAFAA